MEWEELIIFIEEDMATTSKTMVLEEATLVVSLAVTMAKKTYECQSVVKITIKIEIKQTVNQKFINQIHRLIRVKSNQIITRSLAALKETIFFPKMITFTLKSFQAHKKKSVVKILLSLKLKWV